MGVAKKIIEGGLKAVAKKAPRMSEVLNPHIGKRLYITQADRTALDYDQGLLGGPGFVDLAEIDPAKYKDAAWAVNKQQTASTLVNAMAQNPEEAIWTNLIGSPTQHRSNQIVFDRIMNQFNKAVQEDRLTPELRKTINNRLANMKDDKTGTYFFPKNVDILSPDFAEHAQTFDNRAMIASILSGEGIKKDMKALYKQPGTIVDTYGDIIRDTSDPLLVNANTHDIGNRLFSLSGNIEENADLHPAFPFILKGRKESEAFTPAPKEIVLENYVNKYMKENKGKKPGTFALTRGYPPSVEVDEPLVERLFKSGYAGGGLAKKIAKKLAQELPEASASGKTPIATTVGTYRKASPILLEDIKDVNAPILDYGAGMGLGAEELRKTFPNVKTLEPFYEGKFDFTDPLKVPSGEFKGLTNFSVLNAVTPEVRDSIVENIGRVMDRGGVGLITARSPSAVMSTKGKLVDEPNAMITQKGTYQKGFDTDELRKYIKYILGSDFEYEPLKGLSGTSVKVKKKADGGTITTPEIEVTPEYETLKEVPRIGKISGKIADVLKPASRFLEKYQIIPEIPLIGGADLADITGVKGVQTLAEDMSYGYKPIRNLERGKLQTSYFDPRILDATDLAGTAAGVPILAKNLGKTAIKEGMKQIETGTGMLGRNVINPRMNIIKDQGGMLVGGEKALDQELLNIKKNEALNVDMTGANTLPEMFARREVAPKDPNAVALNSWVDTKVRKYIRNQAGSEADPILKAIDSGVDYNFTPPQSGDTKYTIAMKRKLAGKDPQGIATTERGKDWEYTVDSIFNPVKSSEIKDILQRNKDLPPSEASDKFLASVLRTEHDLPIYNKQDLENLKLINQIPDETVYGLNPEITNRLGLNHMTDVIMSDLESGRLKPEQLNQMSMEKAIRRVAEFDAEQAKIASKAEADTIKDLPVYNTYDQGYKWIELNHPTDELITRKALTSESNQMGHCVGRLAKYREGIENGTKRIYSLRDANNKPHITIEEDIYRNPDAFVKANAETIANDPDLANIKYSDDVDYRYGDYRLTDDELNNNFIGELIRTMKKKGLPINEDPSTTYSIINQVKGKENTRPNEKYQSYLTDFLKNSPIKHEIAEIKELQNTNILDIDKIIQHGIVPKEVHFHPVVESAVKNYPKENILSTFGKLDMKPSKMEIDEAVKYQMFKDVANDLAIQKNYYPTNEDVISHIKNKYLPTQKAKGGSIDLQQEYKLENMRRRYG